MTKPTPTDALLRLANKIAREHRFNSAVVIGARETEDGAAVRLFGGGNQTANAAHVEGIARSLLETIKAKIETAATACDCAACNSRLARVSAALAVLAVDDDDEDAAPAPAPAKGLH